MMEPSKNTVVLLETLLALARSGEVQSVAIAVGGPKFDALDYAASYSGDVSEFAVMRAQLGALAYKLDQLHADMAGKQNAGTETKQPQLTLVPTRSEQE